MRVLFLLPGSGFNPIGGFKVVYNYADHLAGRGHDVSVAHIAFLSSKSDPLWVKFRGHVLFYLKQIILNKWKPNSWFNFTHNVRLTWLPVQTPLLLPKADVYVATWWQTAEHLASWRKCEGKRLYLIQHFETWGGPADQVKATWRLPLEKVVIAKWLQNIAAAQGEKAYYVPNGMDFESFGCDTPIPARNPFHMVMLFHNYDWKGSNDGIEALKLLKTRFAELSVELFGVPKPPPNLPEWIAYRQNPPQNHLRAMYNRAAIFLAPSWAEGWPLPPAEAMACGAAVVATDIGGHQEFCIAEETALLAPVKNPVALASQITRLLEDNELRVKIATQGHKYISQFTWDRAVSSFETILTTSSAID